MADLRELTTDAKRLYESLDYLLEKQNSINNEEIDFKEIWFSAKARPFITHSIEKLDADVAKKYLVILSASIALADTSKKKLAQIRFLARIMAACKEFELNLRDIVNDGMLLKEKNIDELQEIKDMDVKIYLLIDLLLMTYLDGSLCDKQVDYAVGTMAYLGIGRDRVEAVGNVVKGILQQDDALVIKQVKNINITGVYCYMKNRPDGVLVTNLNKAKSVKAEKIIFSGLSWEHVGIDVDKYSADIIEFNECTFKSIHGFLCKNKKLILNKCAFVDCEVKETLFILANTTISGCRFDTIKATAVRKSHLMYLLNSEIVDTQFKNISVRTNDKNSGGFLKCKQSVLKSIIFDTVIAEGGVESYNFYRRLFDIYEGMVDDCRFINCRIIRGMILLNISPDTIESKVIIQNSPGDKTHSSRENEYDTQFKDIFGGK